MKKFQKKLMLRLAVIIAIVSYTPMLVATNGYTQMLALSKNGADVSTRWGWDVSDDSEALEGDYLSEEINITLDAEPGIFINIEHSYGNIDVRRGQNTQVVIHGEKRASSRTADFGRSILDNTELFAEKKGNRISIRTKYPDQRFINELRTNAVYYSISYVIEIPEQATLNVENSFGDIRLQDVSGDFTVQNMHGTISATDIAGNTKLKNKFGAISVERITGDVTLSNEHGPITCTDVSEELVIETSFSTVGVIGVGTDVKISNLHGPLTVEKVGGKVDLETGYASLDCNNIGGTADIRNTHGSVTVRNVKDDVTVNSGFGSIVAEDIVGNLKSSNQHSAFDAKNISGDIDIETSDGPVTIDDIGGNIEVINQRGSITAKHIAERNSKDTKHISLKTTFNSIHLSLPDTASVTLTASALQGGITCDFPILMNLNGKKSSNLLERITGTIGNGKDVIILENSHGNISIEKLTK